MYLVKFTNWNWNFWQVFLLSVCSPLDYTNLYIIVLFTYYAYPWYIWNYTMCWTSSLIGTNTKMYQWIIWSIISFLISNILLRTFIPKYQITLDINHIILFNTKTCDALNSDRLQASLRNKSSVWLY